MPQSGYWAGLYDGFGFELPVEMCAGGVVYFVFSASKIFKAFLQLSELVKSENLWWEEMNVRAGQVEKGAATSPVYGQAKPGGDKYLCQVHQLTRPWFIGGGTE